MHSPRFARPCALVLAALAPLACQPAEPEGTSTISQALVTTLVAKKSSWKYLDNGSNQGTAWRGTGFNDAAWASGLGELGYGDGDEATVVGYGGNASAKYITTYFRRSFTVTNPGAFTSLSLGLVRDDGAVVYLNGTEVFRSNMPTGTVAYNTLASSAIDDQTYFTASVSPSLLIAGTNVLAVEIHQANATSSDISMDAELTASDGGAVAPTLTRGPYLQLGTSTSATIRFRTDSSIVGRVSYGASASALSTVVDEAAAGTEHVITLTGLAPNTTYFYSVGSSTVTLAGGDANHAFTTAPTPGTAKPTRVWALGDSGTANQDARNVRDGFATFTGTRVPEVLLMLGDNAYNTGTDAEYQAAVFNIYPTTLRTTFLWPVIGNHDTASSANPPATLPYFQMFTLPTAGEAGGVASGTEKYYAFDYGDIHFVVLDSMSSTRTSGSAMLTWLSNDLAASTRRWTIAAFHHPPYSKGSHNSDTETELIQMRENVLPILESHGVDVVLAGHSHGYERSFLLDGAYNTPTTIGASNKKNGGSGREDGTGAYSKNAGGRNGAVYVVAGSSGKISSPVPAYNHPAMYLSLNQLGSLVLDIDGNRLDARFLRAQGASPAVGDYFTLLKGAPPANAAPTVSLTGPAGGATFTAPATVSLEASASDSDGSVARVDFYQNSTLLGTDSAAPFAFSWTNVAAGTYSLTAVAVDNAGASTTSTAVSITVASPPPPPDAGGPVDATPTVDVASPPPPPDAGGPVDATPTVDVAPPPPANVAPTVSLTGPAAGATFTAPATVSLGAGASDSDGSVVRVDFYQGSTLLGTDSSAPYAYSWTSVPAGTYSLTAVAVDNAGASTTSTAVPITVNPAPPPPPTTLIARGASGWRYTTGSAAPAAQGSTTWKQRTFTDSSWATGKAQLGYGGNGEATKIPCCASGSKTKYITSYFRLAFSVTNPADYASLVVDLLRDDGAVVYLNGTEVFRSNMPSGTIGHGTPASSTVGGTGETTWHSKTISNAASLLVAGTNVIAVEVHQINNTSSDVSFDLGLRKP
jgi:hypothetical protein